MNILKQFDTVSSSENGSWLHLCAPSSDEKIYVDDKKKKPLRIKLKGPDSDTWTSFQRKAMKSNKKDDRAPEDISLEDSKLFAKMTLEWENMPDDVGVCSFENAIKLYLNYKDIRMQALRFVMNQENFTQVLLEA